MKNIYQPIIRAAVIFIIIVALLKCVPHRPAYRTFTHVDYPNSDEQGVVLTDTTTSSRSAFHPHN